LLKQTLDLTPQIWSNSGKDAAPTLKSGVVQFFDLPPAFAVHNGS
jgi:hypothetical protein